MRQENETRGARSSEVVSWNMKQGYWPGCGGDYEKLLGCTGS